VAGLEAQLAEAKLRLEVAEREAHALRAEIGTRSAAEAEAQVCQLTNSLPTRVNLTIVRQPDYAS
jgi:hypothetical protein